MAQIIDGKKISQEIKDEIKEQVAQLKAEGSEVCLAVIQVGNNPASTVYVGNKKKACAYTGITSLAYELPEETTEEELLQKIEELNQDKKVNGILVQLPLPKHMDEDKIIEAISPAKDVDGFHPVNVGALSIGKDGFISCTPYGIIQLLKRSGTEIDGKNCVIIGRSNIVGKPMAQLLLRENGTVTIVHSHTKNLKEITAQADIVVAAIGKANYITADYIKEGAVVIDVGINRNENGKLCGDVDFAQVSEKASAITPVPGGVRTYDHRNAYAELSGSFQEAEFLIFADIIVDISHEKLDRPFQYIIPESLEDKILIGSAVKIPFGKGNRIIPGYVIGITEIPSWEVDKMKEILSVEEKKITLESELIQIAWFIRETCGATMNQALKTVIPVKSKTKEIEKAEISLAQDYQTTEKWQELLEHYQKKHAAVRIRLVEALMKQTVLNQEYVKNVLKISSSVLKEMEKGNIITVKRTRTYRNPLTFLDDYRTDTDKDADVSLNEGQKQIVESICSDSSMVHLIHGITGSGKTRIYMELIPPDSFGRKTGNYHDS